MGTQKNRLNKAVLLSTQNTCSNGWIRIYLQFYTQNFCLSKPMYIIWTICCSYQKLKMQKRVILNKYTKLKIEGQWSRMSILSNRLLKNYQSINQFTENDQWSMNSINRPTTSHCWFVKVKCIECSPCHTGMVHCENCCIRLVKGTPCFMGWYLSELERELETSSLLPSFAFSNNVLLTSSR